VRTVCLVDTSVFVEWLQVPGKTDPTRRRAIVERLRRVLQTNSGWTLLVPVTVIIETGNHIGQCSPNGQVRRATAERFCTQVSSALRGEAPWAPTRPVSIDELQRALDAFVEHVTPSVAGKGSGLGDLTIILEWERQRTLNPNSRVLIWSLDAQLAGYDTHPGEG
jgi:hypothetical protein